MAWLHVENITRSAMVDAVDDRINAGAGAGTIAIYTTGSGIPANAGVAITDQTLLATLTFSDPAFGAAASGVITANTITPGTAVANGTATWARVRESAGGTIFDCDVSATTGTFVLNTVTIVSGASVACTSATLTMPTGA
jgi:hypothetical protein